MTSRLSETNDPNLLSLMRELVPRKASYEYRPLQEADSIRLFILEPSSDGSENAAGVKGSLLHTTLSLQRRDLLDPFLALSYVWGGGMDQLVVDGQIVHVTHNLYEALRNIRDETRPMKIWADALCINQDDDHEKSIQVPLMGRIYSAASHTIIFLGNSSLEIPDIAQAIESLKGHADKMSEGFKSLWCQVFNLLLASPWFRRVWIFQELVLSRDPWVQCGRSRVSWEELNSLLSFAHHMRSSLGYGLSSEATVLSESAQEGLELSIKMNDAWFQKRREKPSLTLLELLISRRGLGVTNPADYVYAHIGLAADDWTSYVTVDYSKSTVRLFEELAVHWYDTAEIQILSQLNNTSKGKAQGPSWVPDWSIPACVAPKGFDRNININTRKPLRGTDGGYRVFLSERHILAWLARQHRKITRISIPLNGALIHQSKREAFTRRLATLEASYHELGFKDLYDKYLDNNNDKVKILIKTFRDIYQDIYTAWQEAVNDHRILPPVSITVYGDDERLCEVITLFFCPDEDYNPSLDDSNSGWLDFLEYTGYCITDLLIQYFVPGFDKRIIDNKVLMRAISGTFFGPRLWLGPKIAQVDDMIYGFHSFEPFRRTNYIPFLVRPCKNADALISKEEEDWIRKRLVARSRFTPPVMVCSMIGLCYGPVSSQRIIASPTEYLRLNRDDCILAIV
ncbi:hypothetical protein HYFRA_00000251 [Hymenoscyphus fraxineus]|uniref:Heterokaryon incompatibility domain-containing protein n=1 Tax=Hymenoscyphus fraxineus TaxID=746836 RepID=A0A9N9L0I9_9HELO|nr:hypothetical protein HYFRA_00000251 [Hymenoscyphus fraxineus]